LRAQFKQVTDLSGLSGKIAVGTAIGDPSQPLRFSKGNGRSSSAFTTLKMVALAPIPNPMMSTAKVVKPASRRRVRKV
jgi:hypothetical protein